ncbi:MAG: anhydro-N-acetylmuramic acid kinase [Dokdonella sp.]
MAAENAGPLYLGLISGTSADGIDAALMRFAPTVQMLASATTPYPASLRKRLLDLTRDDSRIDLDEYGALDGAVGECFAAAARDILQSAQIRPAAVAAIGSHGQTVRHRPNGENPFSLQIGNPAVIAERTGIVTVADFRRADIAAGGQGAPLLPIFHSAVFGRTADVRVVLNLGGIANITVLADYRPVTGFDTGPSNCLLDAWAERHLGTPRDDDGTWAASGALNTALLDRCLADPYFEAPPPKSTGREHFNLGWLDAHLAAIDTDFAITETDVQATLLALSVRSIRDAVRVHASGTHEILVCGGGVHNGTLMRALQAAMPAIAVRSTATAGVDPDFIEAAAFAWLARERLAGKPGNLPSVTGARGPRLLGAIYAPF